MTGFGVTAEGFVRREFDVILADSMARARAMFGDSVDLSSTSALRKILEVTADEDAQLWRRLEDVYYSNFLAAAIGDDLDLLGDNVGVARRFNYASGEATITVTSPQPGRVYNLPEGTVLVTAGPPVRAFLTGVPVALSAAVPAASVPVTAADRGPLGDVGPNQIVGVDPVFQQLYLSVVPPTTLVATNAQPLAGGDARETDEEYRARGGRAGGSRRVGRAAVRSAWRRGRLAGILQPLPLLAAAVQRRAPDR
jgi:uncharacterized phage protein gp47/JayE